MKQNKMEQTMPRELRPYEKFEEKGPAALTARELLAILLRSGTRTESALDLAGKLMEACPGESLKGLCTLSAEQLKSLPGIGRVKAMQLQCVCELSRRIAKETAASALQFTDPQTIADYYMEDFRHKGREELRLLLLNGKNKLIDDPVISKGTANGAMSTPREIFVEAVRRQAVYVILIHNHPSGDPAPSKEDILFTHQVFQTGEMIGIPLLDHIIIGDCCYVSFRERGILSI